jgi:hypothetical protein
MRKLLRIFAVGLFPLFWGMNVSSAIAGYSSLTLPWIKYQGGNDNPRPDALRSLLAQVTRRTSIEVNWKPFGLTISDPKLFSHPFIYMGGNERFDPFSEKDLNVLRSYLSYGGFLLIDDNSAQADSEFDVSIRKLISALFPQNPLRKIQRDHSIFRSFYLLNTVSGRSIVKPYLEGISIKGRTVLVYSSNDQGGAWSRNKLGHWNYDVIAGGHKQRQLAIRLGINIIMYALTLDYKKDMVHLPIILERLRRYNSK